MTAAARHCQVTQLVGASPSFAWGQKAMHIVGLVLAVIAGAAVWYWRFQMMRDAANEVGSIVGRVQGRLRTNAFRKKAEGSVLAAIEDPSLAAGVFLYALANEDRASLHLSEPIIREKLADIVPAAELDEVRAYAQWAARDIVDSRDVVRRFKPLWRAKLTREERESLFEMAEAVAGVGNAEDPSQKLSLETLRLALGYEQKR
jgi:hypothetical protein